jgi:hypothetical protein
MAQRCMTRTIQNGAMREKSARYPSPASLPLMKTRERDTSPQGRGLFLKLAMDLI